MSGDLQMLDLESGKWHNVTLRSEQQPTPQTMEQKTESQEDAKDVVTGKNLFPVTLNS